MKTDFKEPLTWALIGYIVVWIIAFAIDRNLWVIVTAVGVAALLAMWAQDQYQTRRRK